MGTTLTGTTPQDTYESLIKVADNGPLSATAKFLSDGEGHDSALALSTTAVGIGTAVPSQPLVVFKADAGNDIGQIIQQGSNGTAAFLNIVGNNDAGASFNRITSFTSGGTAHWQIGGGGTASTMVLLTGGSERMRITSAGNVGIGTSAPIEKATINGLTAINGASVTAFFVGNNNSAFIDFATNQTRIGAQVSSGASTIAFLTASAGHTTIAERARITSDGLTFNGDTAAANALDDYEEGTWTMGVSFDGASVGVTTSLNTGTYTKIGRQVTVNGILALTSKGSSTGAAAVTGLPFTIANNNANYASPSLYLENITFTDQYNAFSPPNLNKIDLFQATNLGVVTAITNTNFANNSTIVVQLTYFV